MGLIVKWNRWLGEHLFLVVVPALILGLILPVNVNGLKSMVIILFAYITFITSLSTSLKDFLKAFTKPLTPVWILILVHIFSPILAWIIGNALFPDDSLIRLGLLVGASIPMAVTSIIWTSLAEGDVALTLVAVTIDTFVVPFWLPAFLKVVAGYMVTIDFKSMLFDLLIMVTLPSILGMLLCDLSNRRMESVAKGLGGFSSKIVLAAVIFTNAVAISPSITWDFKTVKILLSIILLVAGSYILGYLGSLILKDKKMDQVTSFVYSVGMRNISFGAVLAIAYFPPTVAVPIALTMLFQQPIAALVAQILKKARNKEKETG